MCRIVGRVSKINDDFQSGLQSMLEAVVHGGPDDVGTYFDEAISLGHTRLAIIDTGSLGHQPMVLKNRNLVITYNGEIYNYQVLKDKLVALGFEFSTQSDTEVILQAFTCWGIEAFKMFEGIFAFGLYDKDHRKFYLVRDHLGVKPLYYFFDGAELLFSSEVRAFTALRREWKEDPNWKILFLAFGSIPFPFTNLEDVHQLKPGSCLVLSLADFTFENEQFHQFEDYSYKINSKEEAVATMREAVAKAVKKNLVSDVKVGIFLSGGIDSSLIAKLADTMDGNVRTLSVNFDQANFDEHDYQHSILENTQNIEHISHRVSENMFWSHLPDIWRAMDQPSIDGVNTYFIARCAKLEGIKVTLSGLGADEFYGGYSSFNRIKWMRVMRKLPYLNLLSKIGKFFKHAYGRLIYLNLPGVVGDYLFLRGIFSPDEIAAALQISESEVWAALAKVTIPQPNCYHNFEYASYLESNIYLTNQLLKDSDYMGMWHGVEIRVPFLDVELLKKVKSISPHIRYSREYPKYLLSYTHRDILPEKIIMRKKKGFTFPFKVWMENHPATFKTNLPETAFPQKVFGEFLHGREHWSKPWALAVLQQFSKKKFETEAG